MIYDLFTFYNELDLLELRLSILDEHVDHFILTESTETFSGLSKPLYYHENKERFAKWNHKIIHNVVGNVNTNNPFERAFYQKENALRLVNEPEDVIYFGDLDEIWIPQEVDKPKKLHQYNYAYYLNNRSSEDWYGTIVGKRKDIACLNQLRLEAPRDPTWAGWHFTNMGGYDQIMKKVEAYDHAHEVHFMKDRIKGYMDAGVDYLGRDRDYQGKPFTFWLEEENWPQFLKDNREHYKHLIK